MVEVGQKVRDKLTAFEGTAVCRSVYLNGCIAIEVLAFELYDGKQVTAWIDESQLEVIKAEKVKAARKRTGGPQDRPPGLSHPPA